MLHRFFFFLSSSSLFADNANSDTLSELEMNGDEKKAHTHT